MKKIKFIIYALLVVLIPIKLFAGEYANELLNGMNKTTFLVYLTFGYSGMLLNILSDVLRRTPESDTSPKIFDFEYWWFDNRNRLILSLFMIPLSVLFFNELIGLELTKLNALFLGLSSDHLLEILKRKNVIKSNV